jgi:hypothetical protein
MKNKLALKVHMAQQQGKTVSECVWNHEGTWVAMDKTTECVNRKASGMTGEKTGLMGRIRWEMDKQNPERNMSLRQIKA